MIRKMHCRSTATVSTSLSAVVTTTATASLALLSATACVVSHNLIVSQCRVLSAGCLPHVWLLHVDLFDGWTKCCLLCRWRIEGHCCHLIHDVGLVHCHLVDCGGYLRQECCCCICVSKCNLRCHLCGWLIVADCVATVPVLLVLSSLPNMVYMLLFGGAYPH